MNGVFTAALIGSLLFGVWTPPEPTADQAESLGTRALERAREAVSDLERAGASLAERLRADAAAALAKARGALDAAAETAPGPQGVLLLGDLLGGDSLAWIPVGEGGPAVPTRLVVLVHGLDEPGSIWDDLAPALRDAGHKVARFEYPNDQPIAASADLLAESLRDLRSRGVERVDLVCHSMGGLVARDVLTREGVYGGTARGHADLPAVERLILLGTPNHGSPWAAVRLVAEVREHAMRWLDGNAGKPGVLLGGMRDGDGEAGRDLRPGSGYLEDLNARPLPEGVAITVVVARAAESGDAGLEGLAERAWVRELVGEEVALEAEALAASVSGKLGDGVVSVESARLEGVEDVVEVRGNHRGMVKRLGLIERVREWMGKENEEPPAIGVVLDRLGRE